MATGKGKKGDGATGLHLQGVDVAPGVLDTIATLAAAEVEGVASVEWPGIAGALGKGGKSPVEVSVTEEGTYNVTVHLQVSYGRPIRQVAATVQTAVSDALLSQTGVGASVVDVFVDGIVFPE
jgi:uncharacterized alkaline shock family protein YloU